MIDVVKMEKGCETFIFIYDSDNPASKSEAMRQAGRWAANEIYVDGVLADGETLPFNWYDAALLADGMSQTTERR